MSKIVAGLFACLLAAPSLSFGLPVKLGVGLGMETRVQKEINPSYNQPRATAQIFQQIDMHPYVAVFELGQERQESSSGGLHIETRSYSGAVWGRYSFAENTERWAPFLGTGFGATVDIVRTGFAGREDSRQGTRYMGGLGGGLNHILWGFVLAEVEARVTWLQERRDPVGSLVLRAGVMF